MTNCEYCYGHGGWYANRGPLRYQPDRDLGTLGPWIRCDHCNGSGRVQEQKQEKKW